MFDRTLPIASSDTGASLALQQTTPVANPEPKRAGTLPVGAVLSQYVIVGHLGEGGMGVVYVAYDPRLDRKVALKFLRDIGEGAAYEEARGRMLREAQAMAQLSHPNVIAVHDVEVFDGRVFVAMEFVDGMTLRAWQEERERSVAEIVAMYTQAGRGLAAAHARGIVHRDFKPDNVLVGKDGRARVLDFGLAQGQGRTSQATNATESSIRSSGNAFDMKLTRVNAIMGSPAYMSPEQFDALPTDARTDQFSFCVALSEALMGSPPFDGETVDDLARNVIAGRFAHEPKGPRAPGHLRKALLRGLSPKKEDRFGSMEELLTAIQMPQPRSWWKWVGVAAVVLVPAAAVLVTSKRQDPGAVCYTGRDKLTGVWDTPRKESIRKAFIATDKPYAKAAWAKVEKVLDAHAKKWVEMRTDACLATRVRAEQSAELMDLRMECLSGKLIELRSFTDVLATADASVVEKSVQSAQSMANLDICANAELLRTPVRPPDDPAVRAKIEDVRQQLAKANALQRAGRYKELLPIAEAAASTALELRFRPLEAEALLALANARRESGTRDDAMDALTKAIFASEAGRRDDVAAAAWLLAAQWQARGTEMAQARVNAQHAGAMIERMGNDKKLVSDLEATWGDIEYEAGQYDLATKHYQTALETAEQAHGLDTTDAASMLYGLATSTRFQGKSKEALEYVRRSLELREKLLGPEHPLVADTLSTMAWVLTGRGELEEARRMNEKALAIAEKAYDPDDPNLATFYANLAESLARSDPNKAIDMYTRALAMEEKRYGAGHFRTAAALGSIGIILAAENRPTEALDYADRAISIVEKAKGAMYSELAPLRSSRGNIYRALHRQDEALADYQRAIEITKSAHGDKHPYLADALIGIARVHIERRQPVKAVPLLEQVVEMLKTLDDGQQAVAEARFVLAQALWDTGFANRPRAVQVAKEAQQAYETLGTEAKKDLAEVNAWLQTHTIP